MITYIIYVPNINWYKEIITNAIVVVNNNLVSAFSKPSNPTPYIYIGIWYMVNVMG